MRIFRVPKFSGRFQIRHELPALAAWFIVLALAAMMVEGLKAGSSAPVQDGAVRPHLPLTPKEAARVITMSNLFGAQGGASDNVSRLQLVGLMTGPQGFALVSENSGPVNAFVVGEDIVSGVRLEKIEARHIELSNGLRLELPQEVQKTDLLENARPGTGSTEYGRH